MATLRQHCPGVQVSVLGRQLSREKLLYLLRSYGETRQLNLIQPDTYLTDAGLAELVALCPGVEAVFSDSTSQITHQGLGEMKVAYPTALCVHLGHEIGASAFEKLRRQYREHHVLDLSDVALFGRITHTGLSELPQLFPEVEAILSTSESPGGVDMPKLQELKSPHTCPKLWCLDLGRAIDFAAYQTLLTQFRSLRENSQRGVRMDLQGRQFARMGADSLSEIVERCPQVEAIFSSPQQSAITTDVLKNVKAKCPSCRCAVLGREITAQAYLQLEQQFEATQMLDLTDFAHITDAGLAELVDIPGVCSGLNAICVPASGSHITATGLDALRSAIPHAHVVTVSDDAVSFALQTEAIDAKATLEKQQEALRQSVSAASGAANGYKASQEPEPELELGLASTIHTRNMARGLGLASTIHARNMARGKFVDASIALNRAMAESGPLAAAQAVEDHAAQWQEARSIEQQLSLSAAECMTLQAEPGRSTAALQELHEKEKPLRGEEKIRFHQLHQLLAQQQASLSPRRVSDSAELQRASTTPEQQEARAALLARPLPDWSQEQVQEWIGVIGLPSDSVQVVQSALAADEYEGQDLKDLAAAYLDSGSVRVLERLLKRAKADDPGTLAKQTMALHEMAQGAVPAEDKLMAAQAALDTTRAELRQNTTQLRLQVVHLVQLASQHFPELLGQEDVQKFMSTDGLQAPDHRCLADYEDRRLMTGGKHELFQAKYDGAEVCLKRFPVLEDIRAYQHELLRVRRLRHPFIIRYTTAFEDSGSMYLVMEYFPHGSLRHWMETTKPDAAKMRSLLRQVLLALACMHSQNIVHCDIKAENVLVADDGTPRICDFEMSKDLGAALSSTIAGFTRGFVAPEILSGQAKPSPASDMYSFGILVLNAVCEPDPGETYPLTDASRVTDAALKALRSLIAQLLNKDPASRPSAVELQAQPYFADAGGAEARAAEQRELSQREADFALTQGVRWLCEGTPYTADNAQALEETFQRMRLFPFDVHADSVEVRVRRVIYQVKNVSIDGVGMMQCRPDTCKQRSVRREEPILAPLLLPECWTTVSNRTGVEFVEVPDKREFFERKMKQSAKITADTPAAYKMDRIRVHKVVRVENAPLFESYQRERARIGSWLASTRTAGNAVERLEECAPDWLAAQAGFPAVIDSENNEFWLWHGTSPTIDITNPDGTVQQQETWKVLARHGFDERVGGDTNGGLYGKGIYLTDVSSKSHQYATKLNADGHHCMLSCRVTMGDPYLTAGPQQGIRRPPNNPATPGLPYDSVFAQEGVTDNGGGPGSQFHNEYVVFAKAQVYPQYVIWYTKN
jgi:hypothetical protein